MSKRESFTWNVTLWSANDEGIYRFVRDVRRQLPGRKFTKDTAEQIGYEIWPNGIPEMNGVRDMAKVAWGTVARDWNTL